MGERERERQNKQKSVDKPAIEEGQSKKLNSISSPFGEKKTKDYWSQCAWLGINGEILK